MCDYSLMELPNRLAVEGETLVVHRFTSGCLGLASPADSTPTQTKPLQARTFWSTVKELFHSPVIQPVPAVCIPPGARLILRNVPAQLQKLQNLAPVESVTFVQRHAEAFSYRDAVRFRTGFVMGLQDMVVGQHVFVVDLSCTASDNPESSLANNLTPAL